MAGTSPGMEQGKSWNLYPRSHAGNETTKKLSGALWAPQATPESGHVLQDSRELIFLITPYECPNILKMLQSHCISHFSPVSARQKRTVTMVGFSRWGAPYPRGEQRQKAPQLRGVILEILTLLSPREQRETAPHTSREHPKQEWTFTLNPPRGRVLHNRNLTEAREGSWQIGKKTLTGVKNTRTSAAPASVSDTPDWHCITTQGDITSLTSSSLFSQRHSDLVPVENNSSWQRQRSQSW